MVSAAEPPQSPPARASGATLTRFCAPAAVQSAGLAAVGASHAAFLLVGPYLVATRRRLYVAHRELLVAATLLHCCLVSRCISSWSPHNMLVHHGGSAPRLLALHLLAGTPLYTTLYCLYGRMAMSWTLAVLPAVVVLPVGPSAASPCRYALGATTPLALLRPCSQRLVWLIRERAHVVSLCTAAPPPPHPPTAHVWAQRVPPCAGGTGGGGAPGRLVPHSEPDTVSAAPHAAAAWAAPPPRPVSAGRGPLWPCSRHPLVQLLCLP